MTPGTIRAIFAGLALSLFAAVAAYGSSASFQGLGDLPGGAFYSIARGVSADGSTVVGRGVSSADPDSFVAVRWTLAEGMVPLDNGGMSLTNSEAHAVSSDGAVIAGSADSAGTWRSIPFRWTAGTGMSKLADTTGTMSSGQAFDVSDDGAVIVGVASSLTSPNQAFRWTQPTGMVGLGWLPGLIKDSFAFGTNADGSAVCGESFIGPGADVAPFLWTADSLLSLGDVPGGFFYAIAWDVSADGTTIVGGARTAFSNDEMFLWREGTGFLLPDTLHGAVSGSWANAVNADGTIAVGVGPTGAMIWDAATGMRSVKDILTSDFALDLTGWTLQAATDVSADGTVIVGYGTNPDGNAEGWIATIPATATGVSASHTTPRFQLTSAWPNPFTSQTTVWLGVSADEREVRATIYSVDGRTVRTLRQGPLGSGQHLLTWDGRDAGSRRLASGVYFLRVEGGGQAIIRKLVLVR